MPLQNSSRPMSKMASPQFNIHTRNMRINNFTEHPLPQLSYRVNNKFNSKSEFVFRGKIESSIFSPTCLNTPSTDRCSSSIKINQDFGSNPRMSFRLNGFENSINKFLQLCKSASNTANNSFEKKIEKSREMSDKLSKAVNYISDFHPAESGKVSVVQLMRAPMQIKDKILNENEHLDSYRYRHEKAYLFMRPLKILWKKRPFRCDVSKMKSERT